MNFPGMGGLDPSKMSPEVIAEISALMRTLSPEQIMKMQTLMHNAMGGFSVNNEMAEFEKTLPANFREKMARIMYMANGIEVPKQAAVEEVVAAPTNINEARMVILKSIAGGMMTPEEGFKVLFPEG